MCESAVMMRICRGLGSLSRGISVQLGAKGHVMPDGDFPDFESSWPWLKTLSIQTRFTMISRAGRGGYLRP